MVEEEARNLARSGLPGGHRIRLGFLIDGTVHPFAWFMPLGDDFYWGSTAAARSPESIPIVVEDGKTSLTIPRNFDDFPAEVSKFSYHATGQVHTKRANVIRGDVGKLPRPDTLTEPLRIAVLFTKRADQYKPGRSLSRGGAAALALDLQGGAERLRHYFEFFLSPEGTFDVPPMLFAPHVTDHHLIFTQSVSPRLILAVRHLQVGEEFSNAVPDVEIWATRYRIDETE